MHHVWKLDAIPDEEYREIVANKVPVAFPAKQVLIKAGVQLQINLVAFLLYLRDE